MMKFINKILGIRKPINYAPTDIKGCTFPWGTVKRYENHFENDEYIRAYCGDGDVKWIAFNTKKGTIIKYSVELCAREECEGIRNMVLEQEKILMK